MICIHILCKSMSFKKKTSMLIILPTWKVGAESSILILYLNSLWERNKIFCGEWEKDACVQGLVSVFRQEAEWMGTWMTREESDGGILEWKSSLCSQDVEDPHCAPYSFSWLTLSQRCNMAIKT